MKIIQRRERKTAVEYARSFVWENDPGAGFSFPCDEAGNVGEASMNPVALKSYRACLTGRIGGRAIVDEGVVRYESRYTMPAVGLCEECGSEVVLDRFTNTCSKCAADYNMSGQRLAPRSQWGCETGESVADILMADVYDPFDEPS
jgi:hypothetical protein